MLTQPILDLFAHYQASWIPLDHYIQWCLAHPLYGYYNKPHPIGKKGDFITSPEISPLFGEMLAIWGLSHYARQSAPLPLRLVELGPGRGTMMSHILSLLEKLTPHFPNLMERTTVHFIEVSSSLKNLQQETLKNKVPLTWHSSLEDIPPGFTLIYANEFFDALPIKQYLYEKENWYERGVALKENNLIFQLNEKPCSPEEISLMDPLSQLPCPPGTLHEFCPGYISFTHQISQRLKATPGAFLVIDYGAAQTPWCGDTFQALKGHQPLSPLRTPTEADLSHHVDFSKLMDLFQAQGIPCSPLQTQGMFLTELGIEARANQIAKNLPPNLKGDYLLACHRLIASTEMGTLFKVLQGTSRL